MSDPRFARLKSDPRFRKPKRTKNKVVVDSRFKSLLGEDESSGKNTHTQKARIDKYGRKVSKSKDRDNLRRFYRLDEDEEIASKPATAVIDYARGEVLMESSSEETSSDSDDSDAEEVTIGRQTSQPSTSKGTKAGELLDVDLDESTFAELDAQAKAYTSNVQEDDGPEDAVNPTSRLAAVNLDWDHVTAAHLFRVAVSALPEGSKAKVLRVTVYPSDFGRERMEREEREGPPKELFKKGRGPRADEVDSDEEVNEETIFTAQDGEDDYDEDSLRQYQLDRLRYYYAVVTCNSPSTASHIYNELHGTELERSANILDLSYVPENMEFIQEARDECTSEAQASTKGMNFVTDALRHSRVKLTWDDDDPERNKITRRRMTRKEVEEEDFRALLASSSEDDDDDDEAPSESKRQDRERLRGLLLGGDNDDLPEGWGDAGNGKGKSGDLEITFRPALSSKTPVSEEETTLDRYKRKQKAKREQKKSKRTVDSPVEESGDEFFGKDDVVEPAPSTKTEVKKGAKSSESSKVPPNVSNDAELELLLAPDPNAIDKEPKHFDMRAVIKAEKAGRSGKRPRRQDKKHASINEVEDGQDFHIDVKDARFAALHENHEFAIDPSNPHFQNTKAMKALLDERAKRQRERQTTEEAQAREKIKAVRESTSDDRSLKSIVESVKRKSSAARPGVGKRQKL
ncbi:Pre-rRNA-processing protein ESF1 [Rhizoctonia solani 123E]|uniref:Pre-rRNA-processing protein ESF1 n=1 Tax=Rhizoctonia solani 123E TaxID=1423351 RepID=A0A074SBN0_9AGAM|nr:Pre-rRNA-processing protein ESF1 [Rhizoctonia solani 123E]